MFVGCTVAVVGILPQVAEAGKVVVVGCRDSLVAGSWAGLVQIRRPLGAFGHLVGNQAAAHSFVVLVAFGNPHCLGLGKEDLHHHTYLTQNLSALSLGVTAN